MHRDKTSDRSIATAATPRQRRRRAAPAALPVAALAVAWSLAGCGGPAGAAFEPSPETRAAPAPALAETGHFRAALAAAAPDARRLDEGAGALAARADTLRSRAAGLAGPVVDPARRPRLLAAAERLAAPPGDREGVDP